MTIARLPRCIVILLRHGLAQENLHASAAIRVCKSGQSELLCGGNVNSPHGQGVITSWLPTRTKPLARQTLRVLDSASHASTRRFHFYSLFSLSPHSGSSRSFYRFQAKVD